MMDTTTGDSTSMNPSAYCSCVPQGTCPGNVSSSSGANDGSGNIDPRIQKNTKYSTVGKSDYARNKTNKFSEYQNESEEYKPGSNRNKPRLNSFCKFSIVSLRIYFHQLLHQELNVIRTLIFVARVAGINAESDIYQPRELKIIQVSSYEVMLFMCQGDKLGQ